MEKRFLVDLKSFVISVLNGASMMRVEKKRQGFLGVV
jgi:hypothetical protein